MYSDPVALDTWDKRFYGIYRGVVVDSNDPDEKNRIRLQVPQILGQAVTNWAWEIVGGTGGVNVPYGTFSDTTDQQVTAANTATAMKFNTVEDVNRTYVGTDTTRLYVEETGDYLFQVSPQFAKPGSSSSFQIDFWMRKNGQDIPRTTSRVTLQGNPNEVLGCVPVILDLNAGDYVQAMFSSADNAATIQAHANLTSPTRPDCPSVIATISFIGKYKPQPGAGVWVMFEGGDPNFPLWLGAF